MISLFKGTSIVESNLMASLGQALWTSQSLLGTSSRVSTCLMPLNAGCSLACFLLGTLVGSLIYFPCRRSARQIIWSPLIAWRERFNSLISQLIASSGAKSRHRRRRREELPRCFLSRRYSHRWLARIEPCWWLTQVGTPSACSFKERIFNWELSELLVFKLVPDFS